MAKIETREMREREKRNLRGFRYIFGVDRLFGVNALFFFFAIYLSLFRIFRTRVHARIDSSLSVASASARRARIENWECARERRKETRKRKCAAFTGGNLEQEKKRFA